MCHQRRNYESLRARVDPNYFGFIWVGDEGNSREKREVRKEEVLAIFQNATRDPGITIGIK